MKPKRHYTSSNLANILLIPLLIITLYVLMFSPLEIKIIVIIVLWPLTLIPYAIKSYVLVRHGAIHKYSLGGTYNLNGKPWAAKGSAFSISIKDVTKIEKITKSNQLIGLLIYTPYYNEPARLKTKTASELLEDILKVKEDILVV